METFVELLMLKKEDHPGLHILHVRSNTTENRINSFTGSHVLFENIFHFKYDFFSGIMYMLKVQFLKSLNRIILQFISYLKKINI
jgi:hypothetical protein